jgi:hypothetical protein
MWIISDEKPSPYRLPVFAADASHCCGIFRGFRVSDGPWSFLFFCWAADRHRTDRTPDCSHTRPGPDRAISAINCSVLILIGEGKAHFFWSSENLLRQGEQRVAKVCLVWSEDVTRQSLHVTFKTTTISVVFATIRKYKHEYEKLNDENLPRILFLMFYERANIVSWMEEK